MEKKKRKGLFTCNYAMLKEELPTCYGRRSLPHFTYTNAYRLLIQLLSWLSLSPSPLFVQKLLILLNHASLLWRMSCLLWSTLEAREKEDPVHEQSVGAKWRHSRNKGAWDKGNNTLRKFLKHATLSSLHLLREQGGVCVTLWPCHLH